MKTKMYATLAALSLFTACSDKDALDNNNFEADENFSVVEWKGSAPDHFHIGSFKVSGHLQTGVSGKITGGDFNIPIASITNFDLTDPATREQLLNHLKSPDFFNMAMHPNAKFHITKVEAYSSTSSSANTLITGDFTLIGQTHRIQIPAIIKNEPNKISAEGSFKLNRLQWGMNSFNDPEAGLYILPDVDINVKLNFKKSN